MADVAEGAQHLMSDDSGGSVNELSAHLHHLQQFTQDWFLKQEHLLRGLETAWASEVTRHSNTANPASPTSPNDIEVHLSEEEADDGAVADEGANYDDTPVHVREEFRSPDDADETPTADAETTPSFLRFSEDVDELEYDLPDDVVGNRPKRRTSVSSMSSRRTLDTQAEEAHESLFFQHMRQSSMGTLNQISVIQEIIKAKCFEMLCVFVIITNTVVLAWESDITIKNPHDKPPATIKYFETSFIVFYTIEITMRIWVKRCAYFKDAAERSWNIFDFVLVVQGLVEQIIASIQEDGSGVMSNLSFLRVFRLMKVLKVLRVVRLLRAFRDLRLILCSIGGCVSSMLWTSVLVAAVSFLFGMIFLQACIEYLLDISNVDADVEEAIRKWWGSVPASMLSLFMSAMGGQDWQVIADPLWHVSEWVYALFLLYIALFGFVVLNVVSSIFLEAILYHAEKDEQLAMLMHLEKEEEYISKLEKLYDEIDTENEGTVTYDAFCSNLGSPKMLSFLAGLQIDVVDARHIFSVLSDKGRHPVGPESFITGCIKLRGTAKSVDLIDLFHNLKRQAHEQQNISNEQHQIHRELHQMMVKHHGHLLKYPADHGQMEHRLLHDLTKLVRELKHLISDAAGDANKASNGARNVEPHAVFGLCKEMQQQSGLEKIGIPSEGEPLQGAYHHHHHQQDYLEEMGIPSEDEPLQDGVVLLPLNSTSLRL